MALPRVDLLGGNDTSEGMGNHLISQLFLRVGQELEEH